EETIPSDGKSLFSTRQESDQDRQTLLPPMHLQEIASLYFPESQHFALGAFFGNRKFLEADQNIFAVRRECGTGRIESLPRRDCLGGVFQLQELGDSPTGLGSTLRRGAIFGPTAIAARDQTKRHNEQEKPPHDFTLD